MKGWQRPFEDPIALPSGRQLVTLRDAANYMLKLSKAEHATPEWQTAGEAVIMVAEGRGPLMHARIGVLRALNSGKQDPVKQPRRKRARAYKIIGSK